jgi:cohesin complex subunit SA-1/2
MRTVDENDVEDSEDEDEDNNLFDSVRKPNTALDATVKEWVNRYEKGAAPAMMELLNFIFQSCGALKNYVSSTQKLEDVEIEELMQTVTQDIEEDELECPLLSKKKNMKKFKSNFDEFWRRLARQCSERYDLVHQLMEWLVSISSCNLYAARLTASTSGFEMSLSLVDAINELKKREETSQRQLEAESKKTSTTSKKAAQLTQLIRKLTADTKELQQVVAFTFTGW